MGGMTNPRGGRYLIRPTGSIGPVRQSMLQRAKQWLGERALAAGQTLDLANTAATMALRGADSSAPDASKYLPAGELTGLTTGGSGLVDSANGLPLVRMDRGLSSLQVDERLPDALGIALPAAGFAGKAAADTAMALPGAARRAGREFLEAGATGTRMVAGDRAMTADAQKLARAKQLEERIQTGGGITAEQKREFIFGETGWWRGKDGQWRFEIDDSGAALTERFLKTENVYEAKLGEVLDHPRLFEAYPELRDVKVNQLYIDDTRPRSGGFIPARNTIFGHSPDLRGMINLLLHEPQHAIQRIQGYATGGDPSRAADSVLRLVNEQGDSMSLDQLGKLAELADNPVKAYRHLAGETEARATEARSAMSEAERRRNPHWKSHDIPEADQIVTTDDGGLALALDPESGRMPGLPESVALPDGTRAAVEPISDLRRIALDFMREKGLDPNLTTDSFRRADPERGRAIANAFEAMKNDPQNPVVQASYRALIDDVKDQWDALQGMGYRFSFIEPGMADPYAASPRLAIEDLKKNKHLWVYPTDQGFGNAESGAVSAANPLLAPTGVKVGDRELVANDLFRIVHDVWGHAKEGVGFRADGEENAWLQHLPTFRPQSRMALTTETRGQNSWLNFGPHGEANRGASSADTVFAPQKVGDLPAWVMDPNGMPPAGPSRTKAALNIGLKVGDTGELDPNEALAALRGLGIDVTEHGILQSGTEPTLVAGLNRALSPAEAEMLARAVRQEAIAQKVGRNGALFGPGKDKWGPFNDDYFLQLSKLREAAKRGEADPPIFDYSLLERDPGRRIDLPMYDPPRGTPEREARLLRSPNAFKRLVEFARKGMTNDGLGWYNTEELRSEFIKEWGPEKGAEQYEKFIDLVGATSAGAKTDANLKIASRYYVENVQGLPTTKPEKGSGYGHKVQGEHYRSARNLLEGVPLDPIEHPKRSRFAANLKGDWRHSTIDKHNVRALAIASRDKEWVATRLAEGEDAGRPSFWNAKRHGEWNPASFSPREFVQQTRMPFDKIPVSWFEDAPKGTAYKALSQLNERLAAELGVTPAQAQAALWLGAGDATGLGSKPIALMKVLDQRLSITARSRKITKREALRQMIAGEAPLLGVGAASLLPLLSEDDQP